MSYMVVNKRHKYTTALGRASFFAPDQGVKLQAGVEVGFEAGGTVDAYYDGRKDILVLATLAHLANAFGAKLGIGLTFDIGYWKIYFVKLTNKLV